MPHITFEIPIRDTDLEELAQGLVLEVAFPCFVSVVLNDLACGGHEEGGWYYHTAERVESHYATSPELFAKVLTRLERKYSNEGRYPISSVCSDGRYTIQVGTEPATQYSPEVRPHYE